MQQYFETIYQPAYLDSARIDGQELKDSIV